MTAVTATILDGKKLAAELGIELAERTAEFIQNNGATPLLAAVLVGDDPASAVYVKNKQAACDRAGLESRLHRLPAETTEEDLLNLIADLNADDEVHGILVQLPLPYQIRTTRVLDAVHPFKDVDCFHPENVGLLTQGRPRFLPCTPHGCLQILHRNNISVAGKHAVIIGRSEIVGKPLAALLSAKESHLGPGACNATVTVCHSRSADLPSITRQADILFAAIGVPKFVKADMVKPGAVIVDVGINRVEKGLVGDVDFDAVKQIASAITPVPKGIGPLTIAMLLENTLRAAALQI